MEKTSLTGNFLNKKVLRVLLILFLVSVFQMNIISKEPCVVAVKSSTQLQLCGSGDIDNPEKITALFIPSGVTISFISPADPTKVITFSRSTNKVNIPNSFTQYKVKK